MNKTLLASVLAVAAAFGATAQSMEMYDGLQLTRLSDNGAWLASGLNGVVIYDRAASQTYSYGSEFYLGGGNCLSDNGVCVGARNNWNQAAYWADGAWKNLPLPGGMATTYICAQAITPDGSMIVGAADTRKVTKMAWPQTAPIVWMRNQSGSYSSPKLLPTPERDVTGCSPQQVVPIGVSADGNRIIAQMVDYRGILQYQLIYDRGADGEWTYTVSGLDLLVLPGSEWPPMPTRPTQPNIENYITSEEVDAYNRAYELYQDSLEIQGLTGIRPKLPLLTDFLIKNRAAYDEAMAEYRAESEEYVSGLIAFNDAYLTNLTGGNFGFNSEVMSANGKFYSANYIYPDPGFTGDITQAPSYLSPRTFTIGGDGEGTLVVDRNMSVFSTLNDGSVVAAAPANDQYVYSRTPYMIPAGSNKPVLFADWLAKESPKAMEWVRENFSFDLSASQTETGMAVSDSLLVGSVRMNPTGRCMISYTVNPESGAYRSFFIDLDSTPVSIETPSQSAAAMTVSFDGACVRTSAPASSIEVFDLQGRRLAVGSGQSLCVTPSAPFVVRAVAEDGVAVTAKFIP